MGTCDICHFYKPHEAGEAKAPYGYCFLKPPVIILMPQPVAMPKVASRLAPPFHPREENNVILQPASVRPLVRDKDYCEAWTRLQTH